MVIFSVIVIVIMVYVEKFMLISIVIMILNIFHHNYAFKEKMRFEKNISDIVVVVSVIIIIIQMSYGEKLMLITLFQLL